MKKYLFIVYIFFAVIHVYTQDAIHIEDENNVIISNQFKVKYEIDSSSSDIVSIQDIIKQLTPPGTILSYAGDTPPDGWLMCNGQSVDSSEYHSLFNAIGVNFGDGSDGIGDFNLPDLRGVFLRGLDNRAVAESKDPDASLRTALKTGGSEGALVGSYQEDSFQNHDHPYTDTYRPNTTLINASNQQHFANSSITTVTRTTSLVTDGSGYQASSESRAKNVAVNYIIKY